MTLVVLLVPWTGAFNGNKNSLSARVNFSFSISHSHPVSLLFASIAKLSGNSLLFLSLYFLFFFFCKQLTDTFIYSFSAVYLYDLRYLISFIKLFSFSFIELHVIINQINFHFIHQFWLYRWAHYKRANESRMSSVWWASKTIWLTKKPFERRLNNFLRLRFDYKQTTIFPVYHLLFVCVRVYVYVFLESYRFSRCHRASFPFRHHFPIDQKPAKYERREQWANSGNYA